MNKLQVLGLTVVLSLLASVAFASPMILGGTGGLLLPNAKTTQGIELGMGKIMDNEDYFSNMQWPATQIQVGVMKNLEVGYMWANDGSGASTSLINAKYVLPLAGFDIALGTQLGRDEASVIYNDDKVKVYYAAIGKTFGSVDATLSLNDVKVGTGSTLLFPALLLEKKLESGTKIGVEILAGKKYNSLYYNFDGSRFGNVYVEVPVDKQLVVKGGIVGIGDPYAENGFWLGATYAFGKNVTDK